MEYQNIAVLIPAYRPDHRLIELVDALRAKGFMRIVAVDDGGGESYAPIFSALSGKAELLTHAVNRGKGAALKTGIRHLMATPGVSIITADADGQHTPDDCQRIADALNAQPGTLVLGVRDKRLMPIRSRIGNSLTCTVFGLVTGLWVSDTQTGLRGLPATALASFATLAGDRYEYEMNTLMDARHNRLPVVEVKIETIYINDNASSHFDPVRDGLRIYALLFRQVGAFVGSSAVSALVDYVMFFLLRHVAVVPLIVQVYGARAVSSAVNYFLNRKVVFKQRQCAGSAFMYFALVALIALGSWFGIGLLTRLGMQALPAKLLTDGVLFLVNYNLQQKVVFRAPKNREN